MSVLKSASTLVGLCASGVWPQQLPLSLWPLRGTMLSSLTRLSSVWSDHHSFFNSSNTRLGFFKKNLGRQWKAKRLI